MHCMLTAHPTYKINSAFFFYPAQSNSSNFPTSLVKYDTISIDQNLVFIEHWLLQNAKCIVLSFFYFNKV